MTAGDGSRTIELHPQDAVLCNGIALALSREAIVVTITPWLELRGP